MTRYKLVTILFTFILILVACSKQDDELADAEKNGETDGDVAETYTYPLTGVETTENIDQRIISVMVNNHREARPQSGLSKADIVFEILAEGDITRFLALYQSEYPDVIGPVRSAREYYATLARDYDSLYIYHGAADFVDQLIDESGMDFINGSLYDDDGHLFKRESFRQAPHNSYLQFSGLSDVVTDLGYDVSETPTVDLPFIDRSDVTGEPVQRVEIRYIGQNPSHIVEYNYNSEAETFERFEDGSQTVELNTEEPVELTNIFVIEAEHEIIDSSGRRNVDLQSGGQAYLIQGGSYEAVQWENKNGQIVPVKNGEPIGFIPGKTWINVVPSDPGIDASVQFHSD